MAQQFPHQPREATARPQEHGSDWDKRVDSWEEIASTAAFQRFAQRVREFACPRPDDLVVDLGAGTGLLTLALATQVERVVAVDASPAMLERLSEHAREARLPNIEVVVADLRSLPLPDESVTLAVSSYAFHHLDDTGKELALAELRRVLAPGGRLVICDMMFSLSLEPRDRAIIWSKLRLLAQQGPSGLLRIARNGYRVARGRWEHPAPPAAWERMLAARHFVDIAAEPLDHEAGVVVARRPEPVPGLATPAARPAAGARSR